MCSRTCAVVVLSCAALCAADDSLTRWKVHDRSRPLPPVITPAAPGKPPSDAIVLFDGKDLSKWRNGKGGPAEWRVRDGFMEVAPGTKDIHTEQSFGSCQLHVEWAAPDPPREKDQGRGNSGVYLMNVYELQVLDSYQNQTYADGQAGAVYGQYPPLVNASLPPGQWQNYDVVFHRPHFAADGKVLRPARITVLHNGVLVQDNITLTGPTWYMARPPYKAHPDKLPILLQDHDQPVRFRNIWIRELAE
jgi:hypothetical protein